MKYFLIACLCAAVFGQYSSLTDMQGGNAGGAAVQFLKLPVGGASAAMGGNGTSMLDDASVLYWNPALSASFVTKEIYLSHSELSFGLRHEYAAAALPFRNLGVFGIQWNMLRTGTIGDARDIDENPVSPSALDMSLGLSYARGFFENILQVGVLGQYVQSRLEDQTARAFAVNTGIAARLPFRALTSLSAINLGAPLTYGTEKEYLPLGIVWDLGRRFYHELAGVSLGLKKFTDSPLKIGAGGEFLIHPALGLRAGYEYTLNNDDPGAIKGLSAGLALRQGNFKVDYAYVARGDYLGSAHVIDAGFRFMKLAPPADEDHYEKALAFFKKKKYTKCIESARIALNRNPNHWQAHQLIEEALRLMRVEENVIVGLMYTGNTKGVFVASRQHALGGLARRAGMLKQLQHDYPVSLTLDAGNFVSADNDSVKQRIGYALLKHMKYDALNLGQDEFLAGPARFMDMVTTAGLKAVATNYTIEGVDNIQIHFAELTLGNRYLFTVFGVARPGEKSALRNTSLAPVVPTLRQLVSSVRNRTDCIILLCSGTLEECQEYAIDLPDIDVIVAGASQKLTYAPVVAGKTLIVSPGASGVALGFLTLRFNRGKKLAGYANRIIPLSSAVPEDAWVARVLDEMTWNAPLPKEPGSFVPSTNALPFMSNYDMTAYHAPKEDSAYSDEAVVKRLMLADKPEFLVLDSLKRALMKQDSVTVANGIQAGKYWGYARTNDTTDQIYIAPFDTGKIKRVSWNRRNNRAPLMNAQGTMVCYLADTLMWTRTRTDLYAYDLKNAATIGVLAGGKNSIVAAAWSPDGTGLYYIVREPSGKSEIMVKYLNANTEYNVSKTPDATEYAIAVSPSGEHVSFLSDVQGPPHMYIAGPKGENPLRASYTTGRCLSMAWSASGRYLAFTCNERENDTAWGDLYLLDVATDKLDTLTRNVRVRDISWLGDEKLYLAAGVNYTDINVIDIKTRVMDRASKGTFGQPAYESHPRPFALKKGPWVYYEVQTGSKKFIMFTNQLTGEEKTFECGPGTCGLE